MLQLRESYLEYFKIERSTDFDSPSQCQHQHHHSYFVKMGTGRVCEHCAGYADSLLKDGNGKFLPCSEAPEEGQTKSSSARIHRSLVCYHLVLSHGDKLISLPSFVFSR